MENGRRQMKGEFTGRHMAACLIGGFGIVFAVNFTMAGIATSGFGGVVVQNSYVASQNFNSWLDEADRQRELGWEVAVSRNETGRLQVATRGAPPGARLTADLRRPLGELEASTLALTSQGDGLYVSPETIPEGRWIVRLTVAAKGRRMQVEERIE